MSRFGIPLEALKYMLYWKNRTNNWTEKFFIDQFQGLIQLDI